MKFRQALVWCLARLLSFKTAIYYPGMHVIELPGTRVLLIIEWIIGRNAH